jgi:hypothetical protein
MSQNQDLVYHLSKYESNRAAYEALSEAITTIVENQSENVYTVIWESETHNHGSEYRVINSRPLVGEDTLIIEGASRGGTYQIVPKQASPPRIRYLLDDDVKWDEEAISLIITSGKFAYEKTDNDARFIEVVRDKMGL